MKTRQILEVCIPTRSRSEYFQHALASVARAAIPDLSLLVFQNSRAAIWRQEEMAIFPGPKRLECSFDDLSISASWNSVLERSEAEWIHILHDDDWVEPGFYETFLRDVAGQPPFGLWLCGTADNLSDAEVVHTVQIPDLCTKQPEIIAQIILEEAKTRCSSVILNRALALRVGGFDARMKHSLDVDLFFRVALAGGACFSSATLGHYRVHAGSSTGIGKENRMQKRQAIPILDDRRLIEDHFTFLSKQTAENRRLGPLRTYSAGMLIGALRYYLRRGKLKSLLFCLRCYFYHLYLFHVKG